MKLDLKTGCPDYHGFPRIVDNYAGIGRTELITGKDNVKRLKVSLDGSYQKRDGVFEWIVENDKSINHRLFVPKN